MFAATPIDHAYNATLRLINKLHHIRDLLNECDQVLSGDVVFESVNGLGDIVQQMGEELTTLEWMNKDLEKWWKPLELSVSEAVGRLKIETPPDSVTWTQHVLDKAWRAWNGMNVQLKIHKDAEKVIRGMIGYTPKLEALPCLSDWNQRITKEFRAGGVVPREGGLGESLDSLRGSEIILDKSQKPPKPPKLSVNARMIDALQRKPESHGWSIRKWMVYIDCRSTSTIQVQPAWKALQLEKSGKRYFTEDDKPELD